LYALFVFVVFPYCCAGWDILWHLHRFLQYIKFVILEISPSTVLLYPYPPPIPGIVSTDIIFAFTYMCPHFLHHIHPPTSFPHHPHSHWCQPSALGRSCSVYLFSDFVEEKIKDKKENMTF
jgi:hypothetical protein